MSRFNVRRLLSAHDCATLRSLAQAVLDLADGLGGDAQERDRARDIAFRLEELAAGQVTTPIEPHAVARASWEDATDDEAPLPPLTPDQEVLIDRLYEKGIKHMFGLDRSDEEVQS